MSSTEKITEKLTQKDTTEPYIISQDGRTIIYKPLEQSIVDSIKELGGDDLYFTIPQILTRVPTLYYVEAEANKNTCCVMSFLRRINELKSFPGQPVDTALKPNIARILWQGGKPHKDNIDDFDAVLCDPYYVEAKAYILRPHPEGDKLYLVYAARNESGKNQLYRETVMGDKLKERLDAMRFYQYSPFKIIERKRAYEASTQQPVSFDPQKAAQAMCSDKSSGLLPLEEDCKYRRRGKGFSRSH